MQPALILEQPGSIPACAGEPPPEDQFARPEWVYPRVCGGTQQALGFALAEGGLSPRVRGNRMFTDNATLVDGSIPACAGEPFRLGHRHIIGSVYPRVCGGTRVDGVRIAPAYGLSPRVRGNLRLPGLLQVRRGSIPACAGEPVSRHPMQSATPVYPRVCGGTWDDVASSRIGLGLSPRVRGNRPERRSVRQPGRSIPACAGEPSVRLPATSAARVYPRVCGGTSQGIPARSHRKGLSPRVRGNRAVADGAVANDRSIPACAGEPARRMTAAAAPEVYPRVCGGTTMASPPVRWPPGLSPRVRGNRLPGRCPPPFPRSIPACAGEPDLWRSRRQRTRVYPRVCGGTSADKPQRDDSDGLSPRVRGNLSNALGTVGTAGSIPACAGEPIPCPRCAAGRAVYPRVCGGTLLAYVRKRQEEGLSPRVRGNRRRNEPAPESEGSIPACAGEPQRGQQPPDVLQVYPRVCGGTQRGWAVRTDHQGLSPRVRGNR